MAALNMGVIIRYISDSVLSGFTSAAAILISFSQASSECGANAARCAVRRSAHLVLRRGAMRRAPVAP
eukprot:7149840-Prymnesium_polylepis.2